MKVIFTISTSKKHLNSLVGMGVEDLLISYLYVGKNPAALRTLANLDLEDVDAIQPIKPKRRKLNATAIRKSFVPARSSKSGKTSIIKPAVRTGIKPFDF